MTRKRTSSGGQNGTGSGPPSGACTRQYESLSVLLNEGQWSLM
ncbi:MAG: hypothetical protein ACLP1X_25460 [Polyangiaceae bacterium]